MKFMLTFTLQPGTRNEAILNSENRRTSPKGAKRLGRWTRAYLVRAMIYWRATIPVH